MRGLEIHSSRMWRWKSVITAFEAMDGLELNTLIFHQDDLTDTVVWPEKYFPLESRYRRWPVRIANVENAREYLSDVVSEAHKRGMQFFVEVKEIWFPDGLLELHPELMDAKGAICPTNPFWWDFLEAKYRELFEVLPGIAGVIVSPGSRESKVSIAANKCSCERCANDSPLEWYTKLIRAMYRTMEAQGKTLVVRDFAFTKEDQNLVMNACSRVSDKIVAALKNTPHDFYPTFPNNPRIGNMGAHQQWIEFDVWGQFYGLGLLPCSLAEDMQRRLEYCAAKGAKGAWFRTDIEWESEASVFNSFNFLNLVAGAMLSREPGVGIDTVYRRWLEWGLYDALLPESVEPAPVPVPASYAEPLREFMKASWSVMEKTAYVRGFLFGDGTGTFVDGVENAFFFMTVFHGRDDWDPGASARIQPNEENIAAIVAEKDAAMAEVEKLGAILRVEELPLAAEFKSHLILTLRLYSEYVRGMRLCAIGCFRAKQASITRRREHASMALDAAEQLQRYRAEIAAMLGERYYPHYVYRTFDVRHLDSLIADIRKTVQGSGATG